MYHLGHTMPHAFLALGSTGSCQYPEQKLSLANTSLYGKSNVSESRWGMGHPCLIVAAFTGLRSMANLKEAFEVGLGCLTAQDSLSCTGQT